MNEVLHITAHLGGGVGKVLSNICTFNEKDMYKHSVILLEKPERLQFVNDAIKNGAEVLICPSAEIIMKKIMESDIIQIEWWHHPIMCKFLYDFPEVPVRLIIWSHIAGCSYPVIKQDLVKNCSRFLFTSPYSLENSCLKYEDNKFIKEHTDVVYSSGGFNNIIKKNHIQSKTYNIGYLGTLNFCKLSLEFIDYCSEVNMPNAKFIMVGDTSNQSELLLQAKRKGIEEKFEFVGYTSNIQSQLNRFDVFGYLLNSEHYGTTENALLEAMAAGIPPVVLNQCTEKYLVKNMETGIIVNDIREYGIAIKYLYENIEERIRIGNNARKDILDRFSLTKTITNLNKNYDYIMKQNKKVFSFKSIIGKTPSEWFLSCLDDDRKVFEESIKYLKYGTQEQILKNQVELLNCKQILKEKNKSSIYHFQRYFPNDDLLRYWKNVVK